jgi:DNA-binding IscR family transcriptional regulator
LLEVYEAIEGPLQARPCLLGDKPLCPKGQCLLRGLNHEVHEQVKRHFKKMKLSEVTGAFA